MKEWLQRHPLFAAEWLQVENRVRRLAEAPLRMLAIAALIGAGLVILLALSQRTARPDVWLGVDANQGYSVGKLPALVRGLCEQRVLLLEQPLPRIRGQRTQIGADGHR